MKYKIVHVRDECIGCCACVASCDKFWEMNEDGRSDIKGGKPVGKNQELLLNDLKCNMDAAQVCPVNCIHVYENDKKLI
ncbi:MAG: ferredoxin [Candidatus Aenigmatarchaeota archaeon]